MKYIITRQMFLVQVAQLVEVALAMPRSQVWFPGNAHTDQNVRLK